MISTSQRTIHLETNRQNSLPIHFDSQVLPILLFLPTSPSLEILFWFTTSLNPGFVPRLQLQVDFDHPR